MTDSLTAEPYRSSAVSPVAPATMLAGALRRREVSSRELLEMYLERVTRLNGDLNAVVTLDAERARAEAWAADEAAARGEPLGPLHGLPITIKDSIATAGLLTTCGVPELAEHVPARDAVAVARLRAAGAVVFGKTNTPPYASDAQTSNTLFGRTGNPWDLTRSPGGSSGGPAAAVAAGLSGLELGSDLGGSIRMPAGYCGGYGLRPSYGIVPTSGHIPPGPHGRIGPDMATLGPLARDAADLGLALDVLAGPDPRQATAWRLALPPSRAGSLSEYRIGVWLDDPDCPVDGPVGDALAAAMDTLRAAGARLETVSGPAGLTESYRLFHQLVQPWLSAFLPDERFAELCAVAQAGDSTDASHLQWARDVTARGRDVAMARERRSGVAAKWAEYFRDHDALLCPVTPTTAIPHADPTGERWLTVHGVRRDFWDQVIWVQALSLVNLPVAVVPVGRDAAGLPVGVQVVGPFLEDRTVLDLAVRLGRVLEGYAVPPGYSGA
ncbi:MAG TPA: amidase [Streptosporangiaceae bacterium]|jgi:amidase